MKIDIETIRQIEADYDKNAAGYDQRHDASVKTEKRFWRMLKPFRYHAQGSRSILNIGCGTGRVMAMLPEEKCTGIDIANKMLTQAQAKGFHVARADAHHLPFTNNSFDLVVAGNGVFSYLDPSIIFAECERVLAPEGLLCFHQYPTYIRRLKNPFQRPRRENNLPAPVQKLKDYLLMAKDQGLTAYKTHQWRSISIWPYVLPVFLPWDLNFATHFILEFKKLVPDPQGANLVPRPQWACPTCHHLLTRKQPEVSFSCEFCAQNYLGSDGIPNFGPVDTV